MVHVHMFILESSMGSMVVSVMPSSLLNVQAQAQPTNVPTSTTNVTDNTSRFVATFRCANLKLIF